MAVLYTDEGLLNLLAFRNGDTSVTGKAPGSLRLYTALSGGGSPTKATVKADLTEVGAVMGYIAKTLTFAAWSYGLDTTNHWIVGTTTQGWTFTAGAGLTILGWYILGSDNAKVQLIEEFPVPVVIPAGGGTLSLTINDKYRGCT